MRTCAALDSEKRVIKTCPDPEWIRVIIGNMKVHFGAAAAAGHGGKGGGKHGGGKHGGGKGQRKKKKK